MKNKNGFSLVELLISIVIASILILTVGVLSSIANSSFNKINNVQLIYNDISYGFKLLQNKVRTSPTISVTAVSGSWVSPRVTVDAGNFGIYRNTTNNPPTREFSYDNGITREVILSVSDPNNSSTILDLTATLSATLKATTVTITGIKNNIPFDIQTTIWKRNGNA